LISNDKGVSWSSVHLPSDEQINDMRSLDGGEIVALSSNWIWTSLDTGTTWKKEVEIKDDVKSLCQIPGTDGISVVGKVFRRISIKD
jgi:hypothetical protein